MNAKIAIAIYLAAVVAADLLVAHFGQVALLFTSWVLIPLDLVLRDLLHDVWKSEKNFILRMSSLVLSASIISYLINSGSGPVATASFLAFSASGIAATAVYQLMLAKPRLAKMNVANAVSSVLDSVIFPMVAFGGFNLALSSAQAASKFLGGLVWSVFFVIVLKRGLKK